MPNYYKFNNFNTAPNSMPFDRGNTDRYNRYTLKEQMLKQQQILLQEQMMRQQQMQFVKRSSRNFIGSALHSTAEVINMGQGLFNSTFSTPTKRDFYGDYSFRRPNSIQAFFAASGIVGRPKNNFINKTKEFLGLLPEGSIQAGSSMSDMEYRQRSASILKENVQNFSDSLIIGAHRHKESLLMGLSFLAAPIIEGGTAAILGSKMVSPIIQGATKAISPIGRGIAKFMGIRTIGNVLSTPLKLTSSVLGKGNFTKAISKIPLIGKPIANASKGFYSKILTKAEQAESTSVYNSLIKEKTLELEKSFLKQKGTSTNLSKYIEEGTAALKAEAEQKLIDIETGHLINTGGIIGKGIISKGSFKAGRGIGSVVGSVAPLAASFALYDLSQKTAPFKYAADLMLSPTDSWYETSARRVRTKKLARSGIKNEEVLRKAQAAIEYKGQRGNRGSYLGGFIPSSSDIDSFELTDALVNSGVFNQTAYKGNSKILRDAEQVSKDLKEDIEVMVKLKRTMNISLEESGKILKEAKDSTTFVQGKSLAKDAVTQYRAKVLSASKALNISEGKTLEYMNSMRKMTLNTGMYNENAWGGIGNSALQLMSTLMENKNVNKDNSKIPDSTKKAILKLKSSVKGSRTDLKLMQAAMSDADVEKLRYMKSKDVKSFIQDKTKKYIDNIHKKSAQEINRDVNEGSNLVTRLGSESSEFRSGFADAEREVISKQDPTRLMMAEIKSQFGRYLIGQRFKYKKGTKNYAGELEAKQRLFIRSQYRIDDKTEIEALLSILNGTALKKEEIRNKESVDAIGIKDLKKEHERMTPGWFWTPKRDLLNKENEIKGRKNVNQKTFWDNITENIWGYGSTATQKIFKGTAEDQIIKSGRARKKILKKKDLNLYMKMFDRMATEDGYISKPKKALENSFNSFDFFGGHKFADYKKQIENSAKDGIGLFDDRPGAFYLSAEKSVQLTRNAMKSHYNQYLYKMGLDKKNIKLENLGLGGVTEAIQSASENRIKYNKNQIEVLKYKPAYVAKRKIDRNIMSKISSNMSVMNEEERMKTLKDIENILSLKGAKADKKTVEFLDKMGISKKTIDAMGKNGLRYAFSKKSYLKTFLFEANAYEKIKKSVNNIDSKYLPDVLKSFTGIAYSNNDLKKIAGNEKAQRQLLSKALLSMHSGNHRFNDGTEFDISKLSETLKFAPMIKTFSKLGLYSAKLENETNPYLTRDALITGRKDSLLTTKEKRNMILRDFMAFDQGDKSVLYPMKSLLEKKGRIIAQPGTTASTAQKYKWAVEPLLEELDNLKTKKNLKINDVKNILENKEVSKHLKDIGLYEEVKGQTNSILSNMKGGKVNTNQIGQEIMKYLFDTMQKNNNSEAYNSDISEGERIMKNPKNEGEGPEGVISSFSKAMNLIVTRLSHE